MKALIQRVREASVSIDGNPVAAIEGGLLVLLGITETDGDKEIEYLVNKIVSLRIFNDDMQVMNLSVKDVNGSILVVSQFTLMASTKKGNRPSYLRAAKSAISEPLYKRFCLALTQALGQSVAQGRFGADMQVSLINDGPVTIMIDTEENLVK